MKTRMLIESDIPLIRAAYERSGLEFEFPSLRGPRIETVMIAVDDYNHPVMAVAAERILQLYLFPLNTEATPYQKLAAIQQIHCDMAPKLRAKGYDEVNAFIPPSLFASFSRRLKKTFDWTENWRSLCKRF